MLLPNLSEYDPAQASEGSIDPLGLYSIADSLGVRLVPGVRERQGYPRFLTAIAVAAVVCEAFDEDAIAIDESSEPWQVFEWYMVEGLVRSNRKNKDIDIQGLPGRQKASYAYVDGVPLSADRYLKSPTVFGFHGIYRLLARELGVESSGHIGELGHELVVTWSDEQGIPGFQSTGSSEGANWRAKLLEAVKDGMQTGHVARGSNWAGWQFFGDYLAPHEIGQAEARLIRDALLRSSEGFRGVVLEHLVSRQGQRIWLESQGSENAFHEFLVKRTDGELKNLLETIMLYERFSRLLQDAFDECRYMMSSRSTKTHSRELAEIPSVVAASMQVPRLFPDLLQQLEPFNETARFDQTFSWAAEPVSPREWVLNLLEHHQIVQRKKPPAGKAPWVVQLDGGAYMIRAAYRRDEEEKRGSSYVHFYRTNPLWSFAEDLYWVN